MVILTSVGYIVECPEYLLHMFTQQCCSSLGSLGHH